jgi:hypothetical protein
MPPSIKELMFERLMKVVTEKIAQNVNQKLASDSVRSLREIELIAEIE